jgi:hypothetical protein
MDQRITHASANESRGILLTYGLSRLTVNRNAAIINKGITLIEGHIFKTANRRRKICDLKSLYIPAPDWISSPGAGLRWLPAGNIQPVRIRLLSMGVVYPAESI